MSYSCRTAVMYSSRVVSKFGALCAMGALLAACGKAEKKAVVVPPPVVTVASPIVREFTNSADYTGRAEAADSVEIRARVSGFMQAIHFADGDFVKAGDPLFTIDPTPFLAVIKEREASLEKAKAAAKLSKVTLERNRPLVKQGTIPQQEFDVQVAQAAQSDAGVASAEAALELAKLDYSYTQLTAPFAGRMADSKVSSGALVVSSAGGGGTMLANLISIEPIFVTFDMPENTLVKYRKPAVGNPRNVREYNIPVKIALGDSKDFALEGVLDYGDPAVNPMTGTVKVRAKFDNAKRQIMPGQFVRVRLSFEKRDNTVMVPVRALGMDQDRQYVFVVDDKNTAQYRPVKLGQEQDGLVVVEQGLAGTDKVIIDGVLKVKPGVTVDAKPADMSPYTPSTQRN